MKKIIRNFEVDYKIDWRFDTPIEKIKKDIEELEKLGCSHIDILCPEIYAYSKRIETDEEYKSRIWFEEKTKERVKNQEIQEFYKIKEKYNL